MNALCVALLLAAAPQGTPLERAEVGAWVTYEVDGGGGRVSYLRFALVGAERDGEGRDAVWLELEIAHDPRFVAPLARLAARVDRRAGLTPAGVTRLLLAAGAGRPQELEPHQLASFWPLGEAVARAPSGGLTLKTERRTVMTGVGSVEAACTDALSGRTVVHSLCAAESVPIVGLVLVSIPQLGQSLRLHGRGTAATRRMPEALNPPSIRGVR